ncbi:hypothetical protein EFA46_008630 [Halarchaeum sp. CBA1220]|uniref:Hvo_1808 family surface protein n=1 Tax=Halarchaeum sp. CBA1220 TaxID=1853682 RepID=UPI001314A098|nr:Hvo_1808 family surface protein [Halarchaeum sp. CBA1220]QLC34267.1 hypothetical protein EFA46_008630 [Halarchaeum sp. CBA1220]
MPSRTLLSVFVVTLLLAPVASALAAPAAATASAPASAAPAAHDAPAENATIGYFDGYWYDSNITVTQDDGLNASETHAYVRRTMARVEHVRQHNFEEAVPVDVISRAAYQANQSSGGSDSAYSRWNQQVWEAALIIGSDTNLSAATQSYYSNNVLGYYSPSSDAIKIVVPDGKNAHIEYATLAHELQHALQDQQYDLTKAKYGGETQDAQLATSGLVEGEARYVESRYEENCASGEWDCVAGPSSSGDEGSSSDGGSESSSESTSASPPRSLQFTLYFPYASGPGYVADLVERGGWAAVDDAWERPPNTTTEVIHGTAPERTAVSVDRDAATNGWETYPEQGVNGTDTLGEASAFVGLWWQSYEYGAGAVPQRAIQGDGEYRTLRYSAAATTGWSGDAVLPYRKNAKNGFVWKTAWNTSADASAFADAYVLSLKAHNATKRNGTWVVPEDDGYRGAYRVVQDGETVTVVNGPDVEAVTAIRPSLAGVDSPSPTTSSGVPGVGVLGAGLALLLAGVALARRG